MNTLRIKGTVDFCQFLKTVRFAAYLCNNIKCLNLTSGVADRGLESVPLEQLRELADELNEAIKPVLARHYRRQRKTLKDLV